MAPSRGGQTTSQRVLHPDDKRESKLVHVSDPARLVDSARLERQLGFQYLVRRLVIFCHPRREYSILTLPPGICRRFYMDAPAHTAPLQPALPATSASIANPIVLLHSLLPAHLPTTSLVNMPHMKDYVHIN